LKNFMIEYKPLNEKEQEGEFAAEPQKSKDAQKAFKEQSKKGGITTETETLKFYLPEGKKISDEETAKKVIKIFTDEGVREVKAPDDVRVFGVVKIDLKSHVGFYTYLGGSGITGKKINAATIIKSHVGRGWGVKDTYLAGAVLIDHTLKSEDLRLYLPLLNTGYTDTLTLLLDSTVVNSFVGVGAGVPVDMEGSRTALIGVTLNNTVIPEGRRIEPGTEINGLMDEEKKLIERLEKTETNEEAIGIAQEVLSRLSNSGRYTSLAVAMLVVPQKSMLSWKV